MDKNSKITEILVSGLREYGAKENIRIYVVREEIFI